MKKIFLMLIISIVAISFISCKQEANNTTIDTNSPSAVVEAFYEAFKNGDIEEGLKYVDMDEEMMNIARNKLLKDYPKGFYSIVQTDDAEELYKDMIKDISYEVIAEKINGDTAIITVKCIINDVSKCESNIYESKKVILDTLALPEKRIEKINELVQSEIENIEKIDLEGEIQLKLKDNKWLINVEKDSKMAEFITNSISGNKINLGGQILFI